MKPRLSDSVECRAVQTEEPSGIEAFSSLGSDSSIWWMPKSDRDLVESWLCPFVDLHLRDSELRLEARSASKNRST